MAIKAKTTPARILWGLIEYEMAAQHMSQERLGKAVGVSRMTVYGDATAPERIPMSRLFLYFTALGIDADTILRPLAYAGAERRLKG